MSTNYSEVVSASEIASWEWCPESWRLHAVGREPQNVDELERGEKFHDRTAAVETSSTAVLALGRWLLLLGLVAAALSLILEAVSR